MERADGGYDVSCVAHVHTTYSDGTATVPELLAAARAAGADAVLLTDHDTLAARRDGWEGWHDGVLLVVGVEVSPRAGHYLAFGVEEAVAHDGLSPLQIAAAVRAAGGVGFAAHPFSRGGRMFVPALARRLMLPHGWPALALDGGTDGIELWSVTTDGAEAWRTPAQALRWMRDPVAATDGGPPAHHLRAWDALSARRRVPALGGLDGHAPGVRVDGRVRSPLSHRRTFDLLRTHLVCARPLTGEGPADRATVLAALRAGSAWLARPCVAPAAGARMWAERADGSTVAMGGEGPLRAGAAASGVAAGAAGAGAAASGVAAGAAGAGAAASGDGAALLRVRLPRAAAVRVLRDGATIAERATTTTVDVEVAEPGAYRVEARVDGRVWLLSNPVHLRSDPVHLRADERR